MCVGRVNVMQRCHQFRFANFKGFREDMEKTIADLGKMRDADAVTHWLRYRLRLKETNLGEIYKLDDKDYLLCKQRTKVFIDAFINSLHACIPVTDVLSNFDVFAPESIDAALQQKVQNYGNEALCALRVLFLSVCCVSTLKCVCAWQFVIACVFISFLSVFLLK
jgi:hypothetical protein